MSTTRVSGRPAASPIAESLAPATPPAPVAGDVDRAPDAGIGRYDVLAEQGRGGLGRVLRARDRKLGRLVALKELHDPSDAAVARFVREVMLTARLQHPSIISIYEIGTKADGVPFYAMKLIEGRPLDVVATGMRSFEERLALVPHVVAVADAIAYAHDQGIIHRDLKPANVIVGAFGETVVIDWGLAKDLRAADDEPAPAHEPAAISDVAARAQTQAGELLGTPAYMPPEQMRGAPVDERCDVFALGGILYHVLTGKAPYDADSFREAVSRIASGTPVPLREREAQVSVELAAIVDKAMAADPERRYSTAKELAADLGRYQTGQLVEAHRYTTAGLAMRFVRRHRGKLAAGAAVALLLAGIGAASARRIVHERDAAERARAEAEARTLDLTMIHARSALDRDPTEAVAWLETYPSRGPAWRDVAPIAAEAEHRGVARWVHELFPSSWVRDMRVSNDGRFAVACDEMHGVAVVDLESGDVRRLRHPTTARWVAFAGEENVVVTAAEDGTIHAFDPQGGAPRSLGVHPGGVRALAVAREGRRIVTGGADGSVRVFALDASEPRLLGRHDAAVDGLAITPKGDRVGSVGRDAMLRIFDVASAQPLAVHPLEKGTLRARIAAARDGETFAFVDPSQASGVFVLGRGAVRSPSRHEGVVGALDVSGDGRTVVTTGFDRTVRTWDVASGAARVLHGHAGNVVAARISPDGDEVATADVDGDVRTWNVTSGEPTGVLRGHARTVEQLAWSVRTRGVVSSDQGGVLRVWKRAEDPQRVLDGHTHDIVPMVFSPSGAKLATGSNDKTLRVWTLASGASTPWGGHADSVRWLAFAGEDTVVSASLDLSVRAWSPAGTSRALAKHQAPIMDLAAARDGSFVASAGQDGARIVTLADGREIVLGGAGATRSIAVAPGSDLVATGGEDRVVRLWDPRSGRLVATLAGHEAELGPLAFSPDGTRLASGARDGELRVWDVGRRALAAAGRPHERRIVDLAFSPDGRLVATGSNDRTVRVLDASSLAERARLPHDDHVAVVTFSPDGRLLASGSNDKTVRVWDVATLELRAMHWHDNVVCAVAFSPDGRTIASAGWDHVVRLWPLPPPPRDVHEHLRSLTNLTRATGAR